MDEPFDDEDEDEDDETAELETRRARTEEFLDESNPFYAAKKAQQEQAKQASAGSKKSFSDTSDAAGDILRRLIGAPACGTGMKPVRASDTRARAAEDAPFDAERP